MLDWGRPTDSPRLCFLRRPYKISSFSVPDRLFDRTCNFGCSFAQLETVSETI